MNTADQVILAVENVIRDTIHKNVAKVDEVTSVMVRNIGVLYRHYLEESMKELETDENGVKSVMHECNCMVADIEDQITAYFDELIRYMNITNEIIGHQNLSK